MEIVDSPAVADHMAFKSPLFSQNVDQQGFASAAGFAVGTVVSPHHSLHPGLLHTGLKSRQIGLIQILPGNPGVKRVSLLLRPRMNGKMLGTGCRFDKALLFLLQSLHKTHTQSSAEIRVFPVGLLSPSPARIPEYVHIGGPEGQPLINIPVLCLFLHIILGSGFRGDHLRHFSHQLLVKGSRHADGLGKHGSRSRSCHSMQRLIPPVIGGNPQALYSRGIIQGLAHLFLQRHLRHQSSGTLTIFTHFSFLSFPALPFLAIRTIYPNHNIFQIECKRIL